MLAVVAPAEGGVGKPRGAAALRARGCLPSRRSAGARFLRRTRRSAAHLAPRGSTAIAKANYSWSGEAGAVDDALALLTRLRAIAKCHAAMRATRRRYRPFRQSHGIA